MILLAGLLVGCGSEAEAPPQAPAPSDAPARPLIDLCGPAGSSEMMLASHGDAAGLVAWASEHIALPAEIRACFPHEDPTVYTGVGHFYVQTVDATGAGDVVLLETGRPVSELPTGKRSKTLNVFPSGGGQPGYGIGFWYVPEGL